jgi:hypothetical protein
MTVTAMGLLQYQQVLRVQALGGERAVANQTTPRTIDDCMSWQRFPTNGKKARRDRQAQ